VILFKVSLSLGIEYELYDATRRKLLVASDQIGATQLPTELLRHGCNLQREEGLAGAKGLGPYVAP
jgi:hypothetical protein